MDVTLIVTLEVKNEKIVNKVVNKIYEITEVRSIEIDCSNKSSGGEIT